MEKIAYEKQLEGRHEVCPEEIQLNAEQVLYILGNSFDLMYKVPSSYYSSRDSLGKNNALTGHWRTYGQILNWLWRRSM